MAAGVVVGLVRGRGYLPTMPFALVEGGVLLGVPAALLGGLLAGLWATARWAVRARGGRRS